MGVPGNRLLAIVAGKRAITADTVIQVGAVGTSAEMRRPEPSQRCCAQPVAPRRRAG